MKNILLTTINARYIHSSLGLRYLFANLKELKSYAEIQEFGLTDNINVIAEKLLKSKPAIIGMGVYIWNASEISKLIKLIKQISPETIIILGGPEASHRPFRVDLNNADYIIQGEGENEFYLLCKSILGSKNPGDKIIHAKHVQLKEIEFPYKYYTDEDVKNRVIYIEASRGCPFTCEFCLSSIDKTVRYFDLDEIINELEILWQRGVRKFKFVDRTFNLDIEAANKLLDYFLSKEPEYFIHFEVIPEHFPDEIKEKIKQFPPASLQLEVGIQTLNPITAQNINRKLNFEKITKNISFLEKETNAHLHLDLIIGLPGESIDDFGKNVNVLTSITNSEIQLGILKKLSGTTLSRHDSEFGMVYSGEPPYEILQTNLIPFEQMQKMKRFARYWDLLYNSGNFNNSVRLIWKEGDVFNCFMNFTDWLYSTAYSTWQISLNRLAELIFDYLVNEKGLSKTDISNLLIDDIMKVGGRKVPLFLKEHATIIPEFKENVTSSMNKRQIKHL